MTHTRRERDALLRNGRQTTQERLEVPVETKGYMSTPKIGDNVFKVGTLVRVCSTRGCYNPVVVTDIFDNGLIEYSCPTHGRRNRQQMKFMDITPATMIQFRKVEK